MVYQSTGRLSRLSRGTCANQPVEGTSAIDIGRGGGEAKSEAGNCAQGGLQSSLVPWIPRSACVLRCRYLTVASGCRWDGGGGHVASIDSGLGSVIIAQPSAAGDAGDLFTGKGGHSIF